ncbi:MAG: HDIG domain-containing protein [Anaerolineales bacterium]|nr:HDIG domain-containing protein [Anaerolineales bacterium]
MDNLQSTSLSTSMRIQKFWRSTRLWIFFLLGIVGSVAALSIPTTIQRSGLVLELGDVAPQDILAPYEHSYESDVKTEIAKQNAEDAVQDVYDPPDGRVARQQVERLRVVIDHINGQRADAYASEEQKIADLTDTVDLRIDARRAQEILNLPDAHWQIIRAEAISVLEQVMRSEIREDQTNEARRAIPASVNIALTDDQAEMVVFLATPFVAPNSFFNLEATQDAREQARESVLPVSQSYLTDEIIIRENDKVDELVIEALQEYGLLETPNPWLEIAIEVLLILLLGSIFALYVARVHGEQLKDTRLVITITVLIVVSIFVMQLISNRAVLPYLYPAAMLPMLMAILFGPGAGVILALITGALAGYLAPRGLEMALYVAMSGSMGALIIGRAERLSSFFWAGLAAALAAVTVVIIFRFPDPTTDTIGKASLLAAGLISGFLSASLAFGILLGIGSLLGITTNLQLIELSRPDHPLLQQILRNAPGTYQHSLQVANLAEQAAREVGANALLTRVGALYHDVGKSLQPQFFIENQVQGQNVHNQLDPKTSAAVIIEHVEDGLDLGKKYRLPESVLAFIPEHHGTLQTSYQYRAAVDATNGDTSKINRRDYQYPGPRPHSKETAILMLADGVEAKTRADQPDDEKELDELVRWVINSRMEQHQLDHVDLTLRDLDTIRRSFVTTLKGIYHPRILYPEEIETEARIEGRKKEPAPTPQMDEV